MKRSWPVVESNLLALKPILEIGDNDELWPEVTLRLSIIRGIINSAHDNESICAELQDQIDNDDEPHYWDKCRLLLKIAIGLQEDDPDWPAIFTATSRAEPSVDTPDALGNYQQLTNDLQNLHTEICKLPNLIVGPALEEIFRNLEPIKVATSDIQNHMVYFQEIHDGVQKLPNQIVAPALQEIFSNLGPMSASIEDIRTKISLLTHHDPGGQINHEVQFAVLETAALSKELEDCRTSQPEILPDYEPENAFDKLAEFEPKLYGTWKQLFDAAKESYITAPNYNCSTWTSTEGRAFNAYVKIFHRGQILDIGCGPYADPIYLQGFPSNQLTAVEPLDPVVEPRFRIIKGVNEFLPFEDHSYQTIINATSLDHAINVERALEETARVLAKDGRFLIWYANVKTAPNPMTDFDGPLDDYHLFHTNDAWFLPLMDRYFETVDRRIFAANDTIDNVFGCYKLK